MVPNCAKCLDSSRCRKCRSDFHAFFNGSRMVCTRSCPKYLVAFNSSYFGKYCKKPLVGKCATSKVLHFRASRVGKIILNGTQGTHTSPERNLVRFPSSQNFLFELHEIFLVKLKDFPRASFSVSNLHSLSLVDKNWRDIFCRAGVSVSSRNVVNGTLPPLECDVTVYHRDGHGAFC